MTKYLIHIGICGFGNQLLGFKEACIIAKYTKRTIIAPIFIPHGTIRNSCKPYYKFSEVFDLEYFNQTIPIIDINNLPTEYKINNVYNMRSIKENKLVNSYFNLQKNYYNISNVNTHYINKGYIKNIHNLDIFNNINDDILVLVGTFNNVLLSNCYKNGCLNPKCTLNKVFETDYNLISNSLRFNNNIINITNKTLKLLNINIDNLCVFHMRILDLCKNKTFEYAYNNYNEQNVYNSICNYLLNINKSDLINNIFLISPPQYLTLNNINIFNTPKIKKINYNTFNYDKFILSIIELYICEKAQVFIYSPTNTPNKIKDHTRSSFTMHTKNIRDMSKKYLYDICISNIYK